MRRPWRRSSSRHSCTSHRCRSFRRATTPEALASNSTAVSISPPRPLRVGLLDENLDPSQRLAPPITQLLDSRIYQPRGRVSSFSFLRSVLPLLHGCCRRPSLRPSPTSWTSFRSLRSFQLIDP